MKKLLSAFICIIFLSIICHAQNESYVKRVSIAYGFLKGQDFVSQEIKKKFPDLNHSITKASLSFDMNFGQAENNMKRFLIEAIGEKEFQKFNAQTASKIKALFPNQNITREYALAFIKEIENRANGKMDTPVLETLLAFQYEEYPEKEFSARHRYVFRTKGHPKAKGTDWQIEIPKSWKAEEGIRPNIIQKFTSKYGDGTEMILLMVMNLDYRPSKKDIEKILSQEEIKETLPKNAKLLSFQNVTIDRLFGAMFEYETEQERAGMFVKARVLHFVFIEADKYYTVQCSIGGLKDEDISKRMRKHHTLFKKMIGNSIVVHSQY